MLSVARSNGSWGATMGAKRADSIMTMVTAAAAMTIRDRVKLYQRSLSKRCWYPLRMRPGVELFTRGIR